MMFLMFNDEELQCFTYYPTCALLFYNSTYNSNFFFKSLLIVHKDHKLKVSCWLLTNPTSLSRKNISWLSQNRLSTVVPYSVLLALEVSFSLVGALVKVCWSWKALNKWTLSMRLPVFLTIPFPISIPFTNNPVPRSRLKAWTAMLITNVNML